tara:strand:- start:174 stop:608 length:435 start_codon:yes stop_codon:yes gene_type:complete
MVPKIKGVTIESIIEEVYAKHSTFGVREFESNIEEENPELYIVIESFVYALADYISQGDEDKLDELAAIAKISYHLLYRTISKQMEVDEMNSDLVREAWFRYIRMSDDQKHSFKEKLELFETDQDISDHNDPENPFTLELGGES